MQTLEKLPIVVPKRNMNTGIRISIIINYK